MAGTDTGHVHGVVAVTVAWLDAGQPDPARIVGHIRQVLDAIPARGCLPA